MFFIDFLLLIDLELLRDGYMGDGFDCYVIRLIILGFDVVDLNLDIYLNFVLRKRKVLSFEGIEVNLIVLLVSVIEFIEGVLLDFIISGSVEKVSFVILG